MKKNQLVNPIALPLLSLATALLIGPNVLAQTKEQGIDLKSAYIGALKNNQVDNINQSKINASSEVLTQGKSSYYPKIYLKGTYTKQENLKDVHYANLNLTHTLYKGGRDSLAVEIAENSYQSSLQSRENDRLNLYINVVNAFYNLALYDNDAKNLELLTKQSSDRVSEIEKRVAIGRSRFGELLQAKAQLAQARAQLENAKGLLSEARQKFIALTGISEANPQVNLDEKLKNYEFNKLIEEANARPDIKLKELKINEAKTNLSVSRRSHLPTIDLSSNYYITDRTGTSYTKTKWDVGLTFSLPLFEGFNTDAKVVESVWKEHEARYNYLDTKKNIEIDLTSKFETHKRYMDQIDSFDQAVSLAKRSYDEAMKDYRLGLISNLDVLTALNQYLDAKRNTEKNKVQAILSEKILEASLGNLPE